MTIRRPLAALVLAGTTTLLLSGCGVGDLFHHVSPDEFAVQREAPLVVPPEFALTPPQPGAPRPASRSAQQDALAAMFGGSAPRSDLEKGALAKAGSADAGIRSSVGDPSTNTVDKGDLTKDVLASPQGDGREARTSTGK